ncbi:hypothetical protein Cgig2_021197 [Carnegiea gigantea]|uniref:CBS domain-containing protein n=1 Tax=Carnegiea gigantea TaxID=171969 RepID=A0A9Q1KVM0_9CARY|nr:hypothetical protein Cgig2_021197 [Carnegiea gigantea]
MQGLFRAVRSCQEMAKVAVLRHSLGGDPAEMKKLFARLGCVTSLHQYKGLENTTVADVLRAKEGEQAGPWLWCRSDDIVHDAAKKTAFLKHTVTNWESITTQMAENNVGSLVVLKPGEKQLIAGIFTEKDYIKKIAADGRPAKFTRVGEIMTHENKLITVSSGTNILQAMQLMTENHIRHVPVIDGKIVGMISIVDVVKALVDQQGQDVKRLNEFIRGNYY